MANEQYITIRGRLTGAPELRFTANGAAVAGFTIAANARFFDKNTSEWKDKDTIFWRCSAWKELGENVANSLDKGMSVVALVELEARSFETKEGEKRTVTEARVEAIGPDLRWASVTVARTPKGGSGTAAPSNGTWTPDSTAGGGWGGTAAPTGDPWASSLAGGTDEPPF